MPGVLRATASKTFLPTVSGGRPLSCSSLSPRIPGVPQPAAFSVHFLLGRHNAPQELACLHQAQKRKRWVSPRRVQAHLQMPLALVAFVAQMTGGYTPGSSSGCSVLPPDGCTRPHLHICSGGKGWCRIKLFLPPPSLILGSSGQGEPAPWQPAWLGTWVPGRWGLRLLHGCPQWLWPPSPTEQEREKGQDAWCLFFTPSSPVVKLGPWAVPATPTTSSSLRAHRPFSVRVPGPSQPEAGAALGMVRQVGRLEPLSSSPQVTCSPPHGLPPNLVQDPGVQGTAREGSRSPVGQRGVRLGWGALGMAGGSSTPI